MTRIKKSFCLLLALVLALNIAAVSGAVSVGVAAEETALSLINGSTLKIKDDILTDIVPGTSAATVMSNFAGDVTICNANGIAVSNTTVVVSGHIVKSGSQSLTVVITGDTDCNGAITTADMSIVKDSLSNSVQMPTAIFKAADINGDNVISTTDYAMVRAHIGGKSDMFMSVYGAKYVLSESTAKYASAENAQAKTNSTGTVAAGTYYVFRGYPHGLNGMYNLTTDTTGETIGFWINPTVEEEEPPVVTGTPYVVVKTINKYSSSTNAASQSNPSGTVEAGTYYIYNGYPNGINGMYNLTTDSTGNTAGFWINPAENVIATAATYVLEKDAPKYANAANALAQTNSTGTATAGTYYIYTGYPNGYQGMYCLSTDPTGATASFWINPADLEEDDEPTGTPYVVVKEINKYGNSVDAANMTNATGTLAAGTYYIYNNYPNGYNGMYNITTDPTGNTVGYWINPAENTAATAATYVLSTDTPKYASATDAISKLNSTGTAAAGTYYIYNNYPNGYQGMYNLTTDPTGATAGFWINPTGVAVNRDFIDANGNVNLTRNINKYSTSTDAQHQTNGTGVIDKDTKYYVYNAYPNGLNGVYNITTDSTGNTAGVWVNPSESTDPKLNYDTVKGVWISQYEINSIAVSGNSQANKSTYTTKVRNMLNAAKNSGYNTVFVQVRPNGDSFYPSSLYPMSKYVVGAYGLAASYDPFQIILDEAQELALSVQAWVNPMRLMETGEISRIGSTYKIKQWYNDSTKNGTYIVAHNGNYYFNPAYADVRELIIDGVEEICTKYNVDGIHFDDYFYPEGVSSSFDQAAFSASGQSNIGNFRRACTNALIKGTYTAVKAIDSNLLFGISPAGNITSNMYSIYADVKTWVNNKGYVDYVAPQLYWGFEHTQSPFEEALEEWVTLVGSKDYVKLIIGLDLSMAYGTTDSYDGTEWTDHKDVIKRQIVLASTKENFAGVIMFSLRNFYNPSSGYYTGNLSAERANFEPVLKALYTTNWSD
ncbi:MAG: family 10 glycosylhydrolase [Clostridia bacterium]|nr:family 10 glycosylhydrolase [Clostridia bacterium]